MANVSICNNWDPNPRLNVTDRDERLGAAGLSKSVTFGGLENVLLLRIETFGIWLGGMFQSVTSSGRF